MQSGSSRIWTRVVVSISYDDNHYTTGTSIELLVIESIVMEAFNCVQKTELVSYPACGGVGK